MMKKSYLYVFILLGMLTMNIAKAAIVTVSGNITSNTTWINTNTYLLSGFVYVTNNAILTIQPGTIIIGENASKGALIITRNSKIIADGTAASPIVFTSEQAAGARTYGDWGGLILLGNAPINVPGGQAIIEGGLDPVLGLYGGSNAIDNSGILRYVRIEFAGIAFSPNNEINGLTCGGVGNGTTIDYVQVSYSGDDGYEFFGGTVNAKHLISYRNLDDDFDTDFGFSGMLQFGLAFRDPNAADVSGSQAFEMDNDASGSSNTPISSPRVSNFTVCGPYATLSQTGVNPNFRQSARLRRNTQSKIYNSLMMGWSQGLYVDGTACENNANAGTLQWQNNLTSGLFTTPIHQNNVGPFNTVNFVNTPGFNNANYTNNSDLMLTDAFNLTAPNAMPMNGSPALTAGSFANTYLNDPFFEQVAYAGAMGGSDWTRCWSNYNCVNTDYEGLYTIPGLAINNAPTVTITYSGTAQFCNTKLINSTTSPVTTYQWLRNGAPINAAIAASYTATQSGTYALIVTNSLGCTKQSANKVLTKKANPATPVIAAHCVNSSTQFGTTVPYSAYLWKRNGFSVGGGTTQNITPTLAGNYTVQVTGSNGCTSTSVAKTYPSAAIPVTALKAVKCGKNYSATNGYLACDSAGSATNVQYIFEDVNNPGVVYARKYGSISSFKLSNVVPNLLVGHSYNVSARTIIGSDTACVGAACVINITSAREGYGSSELASDISLYPIPAKDMLNVDINLLDDAVVEIKLYDLTGQLVYNSKSAHEKGAHNVVTNINQLAQGAYNVQVLVNNQLQQNTRITKL